MSSQFMRAASLGNAVDGLMSNLPPRGQELLEQIGSALGAKLQNGNGHDAPADGSKPGDATGLSAGTAAAKIPDSVTADGSGVNPPSNPGAAAGDSRPGKKPRHG
jgi:hypothetical protein